MQTKNITLAGLTAKFVMGSSPLLAEKRITKIIRKMLGENGLAEVVTFSSPVDVSEGDEKCGYGSLNITATVTHKILSGHVSTYAIDSTGSQWRNYGAPHGTKYDINISLKKI